MKSKKLAFVFPGQGAQTVGMGKDLNENSAMLRHFFAEANETLGMPLTHVMFDGPEEDLKNTSNAQPAIFLLESALLTALTELGYKPSIVAGHSVGEYAALVAAGVIDYGHGLWLIKQRGELMARASRQTPGGMSAIIGLEDGEIEEACKVAHGAVVVANYNSPGQTVISGENDALELVTVKCKHAGAKRILPLQVAGAFHSPLMENAAVALADSIERVIFENAKCPMVTNTDGEAHVSGDTIRKNVMQQMISSVQWTRTMQTIQNHGVDAIIEIGPGNVLSGLAKRTVPDIPTHQVGTWEQLQTFAKL